MFAWSSEGPGGAVTQSISRGILAIAAVAAVSAFAFDTPALADVCQRQERRMEFLRMLHTASLNRAHAARQDYERFCPGNALCTSAAAGLHSLENDVRDAHGNLQNGIQQHQACLAAARNVRPYAGSGHVGNVNPNAGGNRSSNRNRNNDGPYVNRYSRQDVQGGGDGRRGRGDGGRNRNNDGPYVNRYSPQDVQGGGQGRRGRGDRNRNNNNDGNTYINRYSPQDVGGGQGNRGRGDRNRNRDRRGQGGSQGDGYASEPPPRY
jgi:hypothetical protein